jgi:hypothetical protein
LCHAKVKICLKLACLHAFVHLIRSSRLPSRSNSWACVRNRRSKSRPHAPHVYKDRTMDPVLSCPLPLVPGGLDNWPSSQLACLATRRCFTTPSLGGCSGGANLNAVVQGDRNMNVTSVQMTRLLFASLFAAGTASASEVGNSWSVEPSLADIIVEDSSGPIQWVTWTDPFTGGVSRLDVDPAQATWWLVEPDGFWAAGPVGPEFYVPGGGGGGGDIIINGAVQGERGAGDEQLAGPNIVCLTPWSALACSAIPIVAYCHSRNRAIANRAFDAASRCQADGGSVRLSISFAWSPFSCGQRVDYACDPVEPPEP